MFPSRLACSGTMPKGKPSNSGAALTSLVKSWAVAFADADEDASDTLTFDEFISTIPKQISAEYEVDTLAELFGMADYDGDGFVTREEFFFFTMRWATENSGMSIGLERCFKTLDYSGDGELNMKEFASAIEGFGFGKELGFKLFRELDNEGNGTVSYSELQTCLKQRRGTKGMSNDMRRLLTEMSFTDPKNLPTAPIDMEILSASWTEEELAAKVHAVVRARMADAAAKPSRMWELLAKHARAERKLTCTQFVNAVRGVLGYQGKTKDVEREWNHMDDDQSGAVSLDEFIHWLFGREQRRAKVNNLRLSNRPPGAAPLNGIAWTKERLQQEIQAMLIHMDMTSLDLVSAYDKQGDGLLDQREYLAMMKKLVGDMAVWEDTNIKSVCQQVFKSVAGDDGSMDVEELERWLAKNWFEKKLEIKQAEVKAQQLLHAHTAFGTGKMGKSGHFAPLGKSGRIAAFSKSGRLPESSASGRLSPLAAGAASWPSSPSLLAPTSPQRHARPTLQAVNLAFGMPKASSFEHRKLLNTPEDAALELARFNPTLQLLSIRSKPNRMTRQPNRLNTPLALSVSLPSLPTTSPGVSSGTPSPSKGKLLGSGRRIKSPSRFPQSREQIVNARAEAVRRSHLMMREEREKRRPRGI